MVNFEKKSLKKDQFRLFLVDKNLEKKMQQKHSF